MAAKLGIRRRRTLDSGDILECYRALNVLAGEDRRALPLHRDPNIGHVRTIDFLLHRVERIGGSMHWLRSL